jgi:hypothetical protein
MKTVKTITEAIRNAIDATRSTQPEDVEESAEKEGNEESDLTDSSAGSDESDETDESDEAETPAERAVAIVPDETRADVRAMLAEIAGELESGEISEATLTLLLRGIDYEKDLAHAAEEGEIRGRNETIREDMLMEEESDGLPHPGTGHGAISGHRPGNIFDLARGAF